MVTQFINGKVAANLVTILPAQRLDQIRDMLIKAGFNTADVTTALSASTYVGSPALADNPVGTSLEGFLYPDSFQRTETTKPQVIVSESLGEMAQHLTLSVRAAFASEGLSVYQGVTLASVVEQEVSSNNDRAQWPRFSVAVEADMPLGSDVTAFYGAIIAGKIRAPRMIRHTTPLLHKGLPPGPIGNVSDSSLNAVAHPAHTNCSTLFRATNGNTYFSNTLAQQQADTQQYCHKLCSGTN